MSFEFTSCTSRFGGKFFELAACERVGAEGGGNRGKGDDGRAAKFSLPTSIEATVLAILERKRIHAANSGSRSHPNIRKLKRGRKAVVDLAICHLLLEGQYAQK